MQKVIELANSISNIPLDSPEAHKEQDPQVQLLNAMGVTYDLAEVALLYTRNPETIEAAAARNGVDPESIREKVVELVSCASSRSDDRCSGQNRNL